MLELSNLRRGTRTRTDVTSLATPPAQSPAPQTTRPARLYEIQLSPDGSFFLVGLIQGCNLVHDVWLYGTAHLGVVKKTQNLFPNNRKQCFHNAEFLDRQRWPVWWTHFSINCRHSKRNNLCSSLIFSFTFTRLILQLICSKIQEHHLARSLI